MRKNRFTVQLIAITAFIAFPVVMIIYNGNHALKGLLWKGQDEALVVAMDDKDKPEMKRDGSNSIKFGIYDPQDHFKSDSIFQYEHIYISWVNYNSEQLLEKCLSLKEKNVQPILTVEPWPWNPEENLLADIINGHYDTVLHNLSSVINSIDAPISISWGHEMDQDLTIRYPWSNADAGSFVSAYRYVADYMNQNVLGDISWIWTPVVKTGSIQYWPGSDYVDFVGMPVYSFPEWEQSYYGYIREFSTTFNEKFNLIKSLNKPVIIMEMGVTGSLDFQAYWLRNAFLRMAEIPELAGVIFFFAEDTPGAWGENISTPDWRSNEEIIKSLIEWNLKGS